jgi:hypothetical protein
MERLDLVDFSGGLDNFNPTKLVAPNKGVDFTNVNPNYLGLYPSNRITLDAEDTEAPLEELDYPIYLTWKNIIRSFSEGKNFYVWGAIFGGFLYYAKSNDPALYKADASGDTSTNYNEGVQQVYTYSDAYSSPANMLGTCTDFTLSDHTFYFSTVTPDGESPYVASNVQSLNNCQGAYVNVTLKPTATYRRLIGYKKGGTVTTTARRLFDVTIPTVAQMESGGTESGGIWSNPSYPYVQMILANASGGSITEAITFYKSSPNNIRVVSLHEQTVTTPYANTFAAGITLDVGTPVIPTYNFNRLFLTAFRGSLFATPNSSFVDGVATGTDVLYFSEAEEPEVWAQTNYIQFPDFITGLAVGYAGMFVFFAASIYLVSGQGEPFTVDLVSDSIGCNNFRTIQVIGDVVVFNSNKGLAVISGLNVNLVSDRRVDISSIDTVNSVQMATHENDLYLLFSFPYLWILNITDYSIKRYTSRYTDEYIVSAYYDRTVSKAKFLSNSYTDASLATVARNSTYVNTPLDTYDEISYKSPDLLLDNQAVKRLHSIIIDSTNVTGSTDGIITVYSKSDDTERSSESFTLATGGLEKFTLLMDKPVDSLQIGYTGTNGVNSISVNYDSLSIMGRTKLFSTIKIYHEKACTFEVYDSSNNLLSTHTLPKSVIGETTIKLVTPTVAYYIYIIEITKRITDYEVG